MVSPVNEHCIEELPEEIKEQLKVIDESQSYLLIILGSILLSYYTVSLQRQQLICSATSPELCECLPEILPLQSVSSIMVIVALTYFYNLSGQTLKAAKNDGTAQCQDEISHMASTLVLLAAMMRFGLLVQSDRALPPEEE